jgi:hypothetical protein
MALLFVDGFDHYATADCTKKYDVVETTGATFSINSTAGRRGTGGFVARASSGASASRLIKNIPNSEILIAGFAFKTTVAPTANSVFFRFSDGNNLQGGLILTPTLDIVLANNAGALPGGTSSTTIALNTFVYIEVKFKFADSISTGDCVLRINGVEVANATSGDTQLTANAYANRAGLGLTNAGGFAHTVTFDDFYICDTTGSTNNSFLGDCRVDTLRPDADGFYLDGTPSTGSDHYVLVDETTPNTSDYIDLAAIGDRDSYGFENLTPLSTRVVYGVQANAALAKDDGGTRLAGVFARSGTTDADKGEVALSTDYLYTSAVFETDPNTGTGWTQTSVNDAEFGVVVEG